MSQSPSAVLNCVAAATGAMSFCMLCHSIGRPLPQPAKVIDRRRAIEARYVVALRAFLGTMVVFWVLLIGLHCWRLAEGAHPIAMIVGDVGFLFMGMASTHLLRGCVAEQDKNYWFAFAGFAFCMVLADALLWWLGTCIGGVVGALSPLRLFSVGVAMVAASLCGAALWLRTRMLGACIAMVGYALMQPFAYMADVVSAQPRTAEVLRGYVPAPAVGGVEVAVASLSVAEFKVMADGLSKRVGAASIEREGACMRVKWTIAPTISIEDISHSVGAIRQALGFKEAMAYYIVANMGNVIFGMLALAKLVLAWYMCIDLSRYPRNYIDYVSAQDATAGLPAAEIESLCKPDAICDDATRRTLMYVLAMNAPRIMTAGAVAYMLHFWSGIWAVTCGLAVLVSERPMALAGKAARKWLSVP